MDIISRSDIYNKIYEDFNKYINENIFCSCFLSILSCLSKIKPYYKYIDIYTIFYIYSYIYDKKTYIKILYPLINLEEVTLYYSEIISFNLLKEKEEEIEIEKEDIDFLFLGEEFIEEEFNEEEFIEEVIDGRTYLIIQ